jgi:hypothetical protein
VDYSRRHLRFGWWSLLVFAALGFALEVFHGFKVDAYLNVSSESRRLLWTLAHAHGTLLSLINIVVGVTFRVVPELRAANQRLIFRSLLAATVLLPGGFFLGGVVFYAGDPGLGAVLIPVGAMLLLLAVFLVARTTAEIGPAEIGPAEAAGRSGPARSKGGARRSA